MQLPFRKTAFVLGLVLSLLATGCGVTNIHEATMQGVEALKSGPAAAPTRTITGFTESLRCMDNLMIVYGVREWPVLVEDLVDNTKKINAGTKDMLISAMSDLSRRSRAIKLVTFGVDSGNLANFHANAESKRPYQTLPAYDIRGSISQLDEGLFKKQVEGGITLGPIGVGAAKSGDASVLAVDLTVISGLDYTVIPGVTSRNSVVIYKEGAGVDGEAEYKKLGLNFGMTLTRSEGKAQALRSLVELSVVELVGKLTHTPYWTCLGAAPNSEAVKLEISDWYYSMATSGELTAWAQRQLLVRGLYRGEIDGRPNPDFEAALREYRARLGLSDEPLLDQAFFAAYLRAEHKQVDYAAVLAQRPPGPAPAAAPSSAGESAAKPADAGGKTQPKAETAAQAKAAVQQAPQPPTRPVAAAVQPLTLSIDATRVQARAGEPIELRIAPSRDAYLTCYMQDASGAVQRFFPNRFARNPLVAASAPLVVPGPMRFQLLVPERGRRDTIACFAAPRNLLAEVDPAVAGRDFENLNVGSLDAIAKAFSKLAGDQLAQGVFHVQAQ